MAEPRHGTALSEARVRTLLAETGPDVHNLGSELVHSDAFRSGEWPRGVYALDRTDMDAVLALLDQARTLRIVRRSVVEMVDPAVHTPARIRAYLTARGWERFRCGRGATQWRIESLTRPGWAERGSVVTVLDETDWSDYAEVVARVVVDLAELHGMGELRVLADIAEAEDA